MERSAEKQHFVPYKTFSQNKMIQGNAIRACATHANPTHANAIRPLPMQLLINPPHANATPAEHHIIAETRRHCRSRLEDICEKYAYDTAK